MTLSWIRVVQSRFKDVAVKLRDFKAFHPACGQRPSGGVALTEKSLAAQKRPDDKPDAKRYEDENNAERTHGSISPQNRKRAAFDNQPGTLCFVQKSVGCNDRVANVRNYSSCSIHSARLRFMRARVSSIMAWVRRSRSFKLEGSDEASCADGVASASCKARTA